MKPFYMDYTQRLNRFDFSEIFREANKNIYEEISKYKSLNSEFINLLKELELLSENFSIEENYKNLFEKYKTYKLKFEKDLEEIFKNLKILSEVIIRLDNKKFQKQFSETLLKLNNLTLDMEDKNKYFLDIDNTLNLLKQLNKQDSTTLTLNEILFLIESLTKMETVTQYFSNNTESKFFGNKPKLEFLKSNNIKNKKEHDKEFESDKISESEEKTVIKEPDYMSELEGLLDKWNK